MNNYLDFKKVSLYSTYIKNVKWTFNFMKEKIVATTDLNYRIYEYKLLSRETCNFGSYKECFNEIIKEIITLKLCKKCNRLDNDFCRKCEVGKLIDEMSCCLDENITEEKDECPICYKELTLRYVHICDDERHKICNSCYNSLEINMDIVCPLCRQVAEDF